MAELTVPELMRVMRECAGEDESVTFADDVGGADFADLGYDSLAVLEVTSRLSHDYGVTLPEEGVAELRTPDEMVRFVNARLASG
ncbi:acyl carrier protein [Micromonospora sp. BRA006-A]|uniref:acyl carrier protein n=1 Tax=Micromonospora sp. BRA006-A TaxID=2962860 RepID=UPI001075A3A9|nr:acyl carrier protein [Micromonospora sp. BRA006-A]MDW3848635.1 acyl carrier protein [Micromonospora sp. BRA006-A]